MSRLESRMVGRLLKREVVLQALSPPHPSTKRNFRSRYVYAAAAISCLFLALALLQHALVPSPRPPTNTGLQCPFSSLSDQCPCLISLLLPSQMSFVVRSFFFRCRWREQQPSIDVVTSICDALLERVCFQGEYDHLLCALRRPCLTLRPRSSCKCLQ